MHQHANLYLAIGLGGPIALTIIGGIALRYSKANGFSHKEVQVIMVDLRNYRIDESRWNPITKLPEMRAEVKRLNRVSYGRYKYKLKFR